MAAKAEVKDVAREAELARREAKKKAQTEANKSLPPPLVKAS